MATIDWKEYIDRLNANQKCLACKHTVGTTPFVMNMNLYCSCDCAETNERAIEERESEYKKRVTTFMANCDQ